MQRKPGFPVANCSIKMPDSIPSVAENVGSEDVSEQMRQRQQLINFGHSQWGFNNWSWSLTKQDLDFVDFSNGKYAAGVAAFVSVTVKTLDIHRENVGYATSTAPMKGSAIYQARKGSVTNALRETLLSFGGIVTTDLLELLESQKPDSIDPLHPQHQHIQENNQNIINKPAISESKNINKIVRKEDTKEGHVVRPHTVQGVKNVVPMPPVVPPPPPVAKTAPLPVTLPPAVNKAPLPANQPRPPLQQQRPASNVSFVLQPVMPQVYGPPRMPPPPPHMYPNYYDYPWHYYDGYERHHGNVNLNFNIPPKNLVVNSRGGSVECKNAYARGSGPEGDPLQYAPQQGQGCWVKPTIFYDGFWTEQKVKKWVAEQVEKQYPEDSSHKSSSPSNGFDGHSHQNHNGKA